MVKVLRAEFWDGYNWFERLFFAGLILMQVVAYCFAPDTPIGIICGLSGVICVALTAKGKISSYLFNKSDDIKIYTNKLRTQIKEPFNLKILFNPSNCLFLC